MDDKDNNQENTQRTAGGEGRSTTRGANAITEKSG
jgi:hypothetical protein